MMVLITYDVNTTTSKGRGRLRRVAKVCCDYGYRVQNSVFECSLDNAKLVFVRAELLKIIDEKEDNLRIYHLGNNYDKKIEIYGYSVSYDPEETLML